MYIVFKYFPLLSAAALLVAGCAGPTLHTIPTKPVVVQAEPKEAPEKIELVFETVQGEMIKNEIYFKIRLQTRAGVVDIFSTGELSMLTVGVSPTKEITIKSVADITAGMIGRSLKKAKSNCTMIFSNKGKVISTNCPNVNPTSSVNFPDGFFSVGSQWSQLWEYYDQSFGKIQIPASYRMSKFTITSGRLCAKIDFEGKNNSSLELKDATIRDMEVKGSYYYDVKLGQISYAEGNLSMEGVDSKQKESFSCSVESILKLDYTKSIFKRPMVSYSVSPETKSPPQAAEPAQKPQTPLPEKPPVPIPTASPGEQPSESKTKLPSPEADAMQKPQPSFLEKPKISVPITPLLEMNTITVTGTSANIRSGAGNEFSIVTIVRQGDKLTLLGEYGEWLNVRLKNGQEGWIDNRFVKQ